MTEPDYRAMWEGLRRRLEEAEERSQFLCERGGGGDPEHVALHLGRQQAFGTAVTWMREPRTPDPDHVPAVRRVVAWDGGDGLVEDIEQAYLDAAVLIWEKPSPSRRRACLRMHHLSNRECDAAHERLMNRLASLLRHRDEERGHR